MSELSLETCLSDLKSVRIRSFNRFGAININAQTVWLTASLRTRRHRNIQTDRQTDRRTIRSPKSLGSLAHRQLAWRSGVSATAECRTPASRRASATRDSRPVPESCRSSRRHWWSLSCSGGRRTPWTLASGSARSSPAAPALAAG